MSTSITTKSTGADRKLRVFVGLSGGVDSSVSAALLKQATPNNFEKLFGRPTPKGFRGYDVTGVFIKIWSPEWLWCTSKEDRLDAMRVSATLGIPFRELNLTKEYKREVVDYMIREYRSGRTPNPDVMCNRFIKFGKFYDWAIGEGADFVATGHYARIVKRESYNVKRGHSDATRYALHAGLDSEKDQSYFLWQIKKEQLPYILFPVGGMKKQQVRQLAKKFGLPTAEKKDSQGLCFVGKIDVKDFLRNYIKEKPGIVLNVEGRRIGRHEGAFFFTLGERHGFTITDTNARAKPQYVIAKNASRNTITVAAKSEEGDLPEKIRRVALIDCNWLRLPTSGKIYAARTRYREKLVPATCTKNSLKGAHRVTVVLETPVIATSGQSLVLYDGEEMLGGGIIS